MRLKTLLFLLLITLLVNPFKTEAQVNEQDSLALVDLYSNTNGPGWTYNTNWLTAAPLSTWYGITVTDNRVTAIVLGNNGLTGTIPSSIGNLTNLTVLDLAFNQLNGSIPSSVGNLSSLTNLRIQSNQLSKNIPDSLGSLSGLREITMDNNKLSGNIPVSIGKLVKLSTLGLSSNQLSGSVPASFGNLIHLDTLLLFNNQLSDTIPASIAGLTGLHFLLVNNNQFTFASLEPLVANANSNISLQEFLYAPQAGIPVVLKNTKLYVSPGGTQDTIYWYKTGNNTPIAVTTDTSFKPAIQGQYYVTVTNDIANQLTLYSDTIDVGCKILPTKPDTHTANIEHTDIDGWTHYYFDNNTPNNITDDILLLSLKKNGQDIGIIGDGTFSVKLVATDSAGSNNAIQLNNSLITNSSGYWVMNRYWQVTPTHEPTDDVGVRFYYNDQDLSDINGSYPAHNLTDSNLIFYKTIGGDPDPTTGLNGATAIISIMHDSYPSATTWIYHKLSDTTQYAEYEVEGFSGGGGGGTGNNQALPVEMVDFKATLLKENRVLLNWQTATEKNTAYFEVQRSIDGIRFESVGKVAATGNSTTVQSYQYADDLTSLEKIPPVVFYRLNIRDKDGADDLSNVITLKPQQQTTVFLKVGPNPVQNILHITYTSNANQTLTLRVLNIAGKVIIIKKVSAVQGMNNYELFFSNVAKGEYLLQIADSESLHTVKVVKAE